MSTKESGARLTHLITTEERAMNVEQGRWRVVALRRIGELQCEMVDALEREGNAARMENRPIRLTRTLAACLAAFDETPSAEIHRDPEAFIDKHPEIFGDENGRRS